MNRIYDHSVEFGSELNAETTETVDIMHYLRVLRKYRWQILFFTFVTTTLAAIYAYTATPVYSSKASLLIESQQPNLIPVDDVYAVDTGNSEYFATQLQLLKSRVLATRVVIKLGLVKGLSDKGNSKPLKGSSSEQKPSSNQKLEDGLKLDGSNSETTLVISQYPSDHDISYISSIEKNLALFVHESKTLYSSTRKVIRSTWRDYSFKFKNILNGQVAVEKNEKQARVRVVETDPEKIAEKARIRQTKRLEKRAATQANAFLKNLTIAPVRNTNLVKIIYENPNRDFAAKAANAVAEEYISSVVDSRQQLKSDASDWLYDRLGVLEQKLDVAETNLFKFKQDNELVDVNGSVERLNERELMLATTELATARIELDNAENIYREVNRLRTNSPELLDSLPVIQNDVLVRTVKLEFGQRQRELDELSNRYGAKHPKMVDAESRVESLKNTLSIHINRVLASIEKDYQLQKQRVVSIQNTLNRGKENIQLIGQKKFRLDALEREVSSARDLYDTFFNKISETDSSDGLDAANARISDYAIPATNPIKPNKELIVALAALASLVLSVVLSFIYEKLDDTVKSSKDIESELGFPLLGILPLLKKGVNKRDRNLPINPVNIEDTKGTFVECVNTVQTELSITGVREEPRKVILVTSSVPSEGKSSCVLNLAHSFSHMEKVLIIDCDMRKPSIGNALGWPKKTMGLSELITGPASPQECIRQKAFGSIDVLPCGSIPSQPLALLSCARFEEIIGQLQNYYDRIIIDSAPTLAASDAIVLSKLSDAVVYVVKSHSTSLTQAKHGLARLSRANAPLAGVLVSQVDVDKISSYGGDFYFQGYYDYYGYNDIGKPVKKSKKSSPLTPEELQIMRERNTDPDFYEFDNFIQLKDLNKSGDQIVSTV